MVISNYSSNALSIAKRDLLARIVAVCCTLAALVHLTFPSIQLLTIALLFTFFGLINYSFMPRLTENE